MGGNRHRQKRTFGSRECGGYVPSGRQYFTDFTYQPWPAVEVTVNVQPAAV